MMRPNVTTATSKGQPAGSARNHAPSADPAVAATIALARTAVRERPRTTVNEAAT